MPTTPTTPPVRVPILLAAAGLALAPAGAFGQGDPLGEPFPAVLELADLDGRIGFRINGIDEQDASGWAVAPAGDVNGDGVDDVIIGAYGADPGGRSMAGESYVVFGRADGPAFPAEFALADLDGSNGFRLDGVQELDASGFAVAAAGDVNDDGVDDLIIGAWRAEPGEGASYVVFGRADASFPAVVPLADLDGTSGFRLNGFEGTDRTGWAVASAGDVNGDGIADVIVGAPGAGAAGRSSVGQTYVVFGRSGAAAFPPAISVAELGGGSGFRIEGMDEFDRTGYDVSSAGDLNGDGVDDLLVGAPWAFSGSERDAGETYVVFGRGGGAPFPAVLRPVDLDGTTGFRIDGIAAYDQSGFAAASAGDFNGDGIDDVILGAFGASPSGRMQAGESYVVFGRDSVAGEVFPAALSLADLDGTNGITLRGVDTEDLSGWSTASAGDVNGDGVADIIIGARLADPGGRSNAGSSFVVFGRDVASSTAFPATIELADLDGTDGFRLNGVQAGESSGDSVASAGDVNADGIDDLVIGASGGFPPGGRGSSFVVYGRDSGFCAPDLDGDGALTIFDFLAFGNLFDLMDPAADFDGDGDFTIFDFLAFQNAFDAGCG